MKYYTIVYYYVIGGQRLSAFEQFWSANLQLTLNDRKIDSVDIAFVFEGKCKPIHL